VATLIHRLPSDTGLPTLIGGDFNTIPGSRTIRDMDAQFRDVLWPTAGYLAGTYHKIRFPIRPRVDYLFVSDQFSADRASVVRESAGDHYPVSAALRIKQTEASAFAFDTAIQRSGGD
jgi:endonuclease/exonuclease/phosphatase (EEP) superfamily protein YafD